MGKRVRLEVVRDVQPIRFLGQSVVRFGTDLGAADTRRPGRALPASRNGDYSHLLGLDHHGDRLQLDHHER